MKIFCSHCKHYKVVGGIWDECREPRNMKYECNHAQLWRRAVVSPSERNGRNNCKFFFPKWHKHRKYRGM
jgi:hypothetical protein